MQILEQNFLDSVYVISHSTKTVQTYQTSINHLRRFLLARYNINETEILQRIKDGTPDPYEFLREFIIYLDKLGIKPKGTRSYLSGVKGYLRYHGIKINSDDFKHTVRVPKLIKTREIPLTKDMIVRILHNADSKLQTAILICLSSGLRVGELIQLKLSDIDFESKPTKITIRGSTSKGRLSRETFLTIEATKVLKDYLKRYYQWSEDDNNSRLSDIYIFGRTCNKGRKPLNGFSINSSKLTLQKALRRLIEKVPGLDILNENGFRAVHFHAFRKYFRTTVGNVCGRDFAEALMGHGFYMDTYYQLSEDKKREMYLDAEPHLTISDFIEVENQITNLSTKCNDLERTVLGLKQYLRINSIELPDELA